MGGASAEAAAGPDPTNTLTGVSGVVAPFYYACARVRGRILVRARARAKGKDGALQTRLVEREGPTGLIVTTTSVALHPENETRLLSLAATDTADQTRLVLARLADDIREPNLTRWHDLQVWLETAEHRVTIPYARTLADLVPPVAIRLRRDFQAVLSLIRSHALLHQVSRERDDTEEVIATIEDYAVVYELIVDIISEGVEATVPATVRETVEAVAASEEPPSISQLATLLGLDKSATSRRWKNARARGYLKNVEEKRGKPARIVLGDPLPDEIEILPSPERLEERWTSAGGSGGVAREPSPVGYERCLVCESEYEFDDVHPVLEGGSESFPPPSQESPANSDFMEAGGIEPPSAAAPTEHLRA